MAQNVIQDLKPPSRLNQHLKQITIDKKITGNYYTVTDIYNFFRIPTVQHIWLLLLQVYFLIYVNFLHNM